MNAQSSSLALTPATGRVASRGSLRRAASSLARHFSRASLGLAALLVAGAGLAPVGARAQTWVGATSTYFTSSNWNPATPPLASTDTATFADTGVTNITLTGIYLLGGFQFNSNAQSYTFTLPDGSGMNFAGTGIVNNSPVAQSLSVGNGGALGFFSNSSAGNATITSGGSPVNFDDTASAGTATIGLSNGARLTVAENATLANAKVTVSSGTLLRFWGTGSGGQAAVNLDGEIEFASYTGAGTTIGSLAGSGRVNLTGQTLTIGGNGQPTTFSGRILGTGSIIKEGAGTLTLTGANNYSSTTVTGGTLAGTTTSLKGNITNDAAVIFDQASSGTYTGVISGSGSVTKQGTGTVTLSGTNTYTGPTTVSAGTLTVNGSLAAGSTVTVATGATLNGTGTINGNVTFADGANLGSGIRINGTITRAFVTLTFTPSSATPTYGTAVTLTATVTSGGLPVTGGTVSIFDVSSGVSMGLGLALALNGSGQASVTMSTLSAGNHVLLVDYSGDVVHFGKLKNATIDVGQKALTVTASNASKTYGTTQTFAGTEFTTSGLVNGDTVTGVTLTSAGAAGAATVAGAPYTIMPSAATGTAVSNYNISYVNGALSVNLATLTPVVTANNKGVDGTTAATLATRALTGVFAGDVGNVTLTGGTATFATAAVGVAKTVTVTGLSLTGAAAANYQLGATTATGTAQIMPVITSPAIVAAAFGQPFSYTIVAPGAAVFGATGLPAGLNVNSGTGLISGAASEAGTFSVTLSAAVAGGLPNPATLTLMISTGGVSIDLGNLNQVYDGTVKSASATTNPAGLNVNLAYFLNGQPAVPLAAGRYTVEATISDRNYSGSVSGTLVIAPAILAAPAKVTAEPGGPATFSVGAGGGAATYQWQRNGVDIPGATQATLALDRVQPGDVGFYAVRISAGGVTVTTAAAPLELTFAGKMVGAATEVGADIHHPNGNIYDQVLLTGAAASVKADPGQIVRVSFLDLTDDIVQVEFFGAGVLTINLENATGPAAPVNYSQPGVAYMKGHATITITGADATSHLGIFTVGKMTAGNPSLFRDGTSYDGWADLALVAIASTDGKFALVGTGNANYFNTRGLVGVYAPGVEIGGPLYVGDVDAADAARAVLVTGSAADARVTGGDLLQDNGGTVEVAGIARLVFAGGASSHGVAVSPQRNQARLMRAGVDVTAQLVPAN